MDSKEPKNLGGHITSRDTYNPEKLPLPSESNEGDKVKHELEEFKKKIIKKFPFAIALGVLPTQAAPLFEEDEGLTKEEVEKKPLHLFFVIPEEQYKNISKKIKPEIIKLIHEGKHNIWVHIKTPVDVWNYGLDSKFEFIDAIAASFPLHDKGLLGALRVANIHKSLVLRKFAKYVASYVIAGSLVRGTADKTSDVDVFVVIDDTDVKKMPRLQLLEKLRGIIQDYIREATALSGVKNILNIQVYLLTSFWESVKDANPVIFTFVRDGVPLHDRGTFLPWKLLLQMGKIKPSPEAVDNFMKYGEQNDSLVKRRMIDAMIDIYWGVVTPTQALMMLAGHAPPVPKTIVEDVKKAFVGGEKIMSMKELKILEKVVRMYKDYEHGKLLSVKGSEIDKVLEEAKEYDAKLKIMRKKLEGRLIQQTAKQTYEEVMSQLSNLLGKKGSDSLLKEFEKNLVKKGKIPGRFVPILKEVLSLPQKAKSKKTSASEIDRVRRDASELLNSLVEYAQRKEIMKFEESMIRIASGNRKAEIISTSKGFFVVENNSIKKIAGGKFEEVSQEDFDSALKQKSNSKSIPSEVMKALHKHFGDFSIEI